MRLISTDVEFASSGKLADLPVNESATIASSAQAEILATVDEAFATTGKLADLPVGGPGWRYEVTAGGKYWQWRSGSGKARKSIYGGTFDRLPEERRNAYGRNRKSKARPKASRV